MSYLYGLAALCSVLVASLACNGSTQALPTPSDGQQVQIAHVVDGDTVELADGRRVRYLGINTPEHGQPLFEEATAANQRLTEGRTAWIVLDTQPTDRYGRILAYVWVGEHFVNQELVGRGYANAYSEPPNVRFGEEILAAEQEARKAGLGLWALADVPIKINGIHYDAPGPDHENPNGEWIVIENEGLDTIDLSGFSIKDAANHIYTFPSTNLEPGTELKLYSGQGRDAGGTLYWGLSGDAVWSNSGDSAYLRDPQGRLVDYYTY